MSDALLYLAPWFPWIFFGVAAAGLSWIVTCALHREQFAIVVLAVLGVVGIALGTTVVTHAVDRAKASRDGYTQAVIRQ